MKSTEFDSIGSVFWFQNNESLSTFIKMWYHVFLWSFFSSLVVHTLAGLIAFLTLRKHKFGKFFPLAILLIGIAAPAATGIVSSAAIAFVYRASSLPMNPLYALFWGCGQTILTASMGFTRILATL